MAHNTFCINFSLAKEFKFLFFILFQEVAFPEDQDFSHVENTIFLPRPI